MFGKNKSETQNKKSKKGLKIVVAIACALLAGVILVCIFAGDGSDEKKSLFPSLGEYVAEYIDYYSEKETDESIMIWYLIDEDDMSELDKYKEGIVEDYQFEQVDGGDDDFYFRYTGTEDIAPLYAETNGQEYHVRIGIGDEKAEGKSVICFMYAAGLEKAAAGNDDKNEEKDNEDDSNKKEESAEDKVLAEPMKFKDNSGGSQSKDSVKFQSLFDFADSKISFDKVSQSGMTFSQSFEGEESAVELIEEYTELLCKSGMNFKEQNSVFNDYRDYNSSWNDLKIYASWSLDYTGTASVSNSCEYSEFNNKGTCAIYIFYSMNGTKVSGYMKWSADLDSADLGFRNGGKTVSSAPSGQSVGAGLVKKANGKYETTDGRFSVGLNESVVMIGGNTQKCSVEFTDYETASDLIKIKDADGKNMFVVFLSCKDPAKTGTIYTRSDLAQEYQYPLDGDPGGAYTYEKPIVYQCIKESWITPGLDNNSDCRDASLKIFYYNKEENVAAFYIYTDLQGGSEVFCTVDLSKAVSDQSPGSSSGGLSSVGSGYDSDIYTTKKKNCTYCGNTGYVTCSSCGGKGYYVIRGSAPNYAGSLSGGKTYEEIRDCEGLRCVGGKKPCLHCNY